MTREELEDLVWELPSIRHSQIDFPEIQRMSDQQLKEMLAGTTNLTRESKRVIRPFRQPRSPSRLLSVDYIERDGELMRSEIWMSGAATHQVVKPCGKRVYWRGRTISASILLHWIRTGELVQRVPKPVGLKPYRAVVWIDGKAKHLGYFATQEARDEAVMLAKLGIFPSG